MPNKFNTRFIRQGVGKSSRQAGFNLLEVLVALVVLAVGLLGLAMLQNLGLRLGYQSYERTQATMLIYEIIDRMRANPPGVRGGNYEIALTGAPPASADCMSTNCTAAQAAVFDLSQWLSNISGQASSVNPGITRPTLAGGQASIVKVADITPFPGIQDVLMDITIQWIEQRHGGDDATVTAEIQSQTVRVHLP